MAYGSVAMAACWVFIKKQLLLRSRFVATSHYAVSDFISQVSWDEGLPTLGVDLIIELGLVPAPLNWCGKKWEESYVLLLFFVQCVVTCPVTKNGTQCALQWLDNGCISSCGSDYWYIFAPVFKNWYGIFCWCGTHVFVIIHPAAPVSPVLGIYVGEKRGRDTSSLTLHYYWFYIQCCVQIWIIICYTFSQFFFLSL